MDFMVKNSGPVGKSKEELYRLAIKQWGADAQLDMVIEECCELIKEILKVRRNKTTFKFVAEEAADVEIMMEQLRMMLSHQYILSDGMWDIDEYKDHKLRRLAQLLGEKYDG